MLLDDPERADVLPAVPFSAVDPDMLDPPDETSVRMNPPWLLALLAVEPAVVPVVPVAEPLPDCTHPVSVTVCDDCEDRLDWLLPGLSGLSVCVWPGGWVLGDCPCCGCCALTPTPIARAAASMDPNTN